MKHFYLAAKATIYTRVNAVVLFLLATIVLPSVSNAQQAVSGIITDFNGFWKTSTGNINPIKPNNSHNLLSFTYNNTQFSTGVNDQLLSQRGETFVPGDFWSLPIERVNGTIISNTKIGVGAMYDGNLTGIGNILPLGNNLASYLTDGIKGLDIGTCVANIPVGTMTYLTTNINPANIGDGIPDILVTQVADPSGSYDRYSFIDVNGNPVGVSRDIIFTNISPVASWTADFYELLTMILTLGFTNTDRHIRLWAADLSDFGITQQNYQQINRFRINLSGQSDIAFVSYNARTMNVVSALPVKLSAFAGKEVNGNAQLNWETATEINSGYFLVEKSTDNQNFVTVDSIVAKGNSRSLNTYSATDKLSAGTNYYRLKMVDQDGYTEYSNVIRIQYKSKQLSVEAYPNPATDKITVTYPASGKSLQVFNAAGVLQQQVILNNNNSQSTIDLTRFQKGVYFIVWQNDAQKLSQSFLVK